MATRSLTRDEIGILENQGCTADDWTRVLAADRFRPEGAAVRVEFAGDVTLGDCSGEVAVAGGARRAGLRDCRLHDVTVGDRCLIRHADLSRVDIGDACVIDRVGRIAGLAPTSFANGLDANVLTEHGGRAVPLWRKLSSQAAHLLCHLHGQPAAEALLAMIGKDAAQLASDRSRIAAHCRIERTTSLTDVYVEEGAVIDGVAALRECYVASSTEAPAVIGAGVIAERVVFQRASVTTDGVKLVNCLVGEGAKLERGFSSEHSLFFANAAFAQCEACSVMAGPFSVSHHKATLALTCQCSFTNFGSGSNASNHHFKLGPLHGGILGRGTRVGSGSYLFWPADIGAFSTVTGRNNKNIDTRDFPFSLVVGEGKRSCLVPAVNIFTTGVFRDEKKWPDRDQRGGIAEPLDWYRSEALSPYIIQYADRGLAAIKQAFHSGDDLEIGGVVIPESRFDSALKLYRAVGVFQTGLCLLDYCRRYADTQTPTLADLTGALAVAQGEDGADAGDWADWGGLLLSGGRAKRFLGELAAGKYPDADALGAAFRKIHDEYPDMEWRWLAMRWREEFGAPNPDKVKQFLGDWREAVLFRRARLWRDAVKDFSIEKRISFGIEQSCDDDFREARGKFEAHPLVIAIEEETANLIARVESILAEG